MSPRNDDAEDRPQSMQLAGRFGFRPCSASFVVHDTFRRRGATLATAIEEQWLMNHGGRLRPIRRGSHEQKEPSVFTDGSVFIALTTQAAADSGGYQI